MQLNSTSYIIKFALVVCVACSLLVSSAAVLLKSRQKQNALLDKQRNVLSVAGLLEPGEKLGAAQIQDLFKQRVEAQLVEMQTGQPVTAESAGIDPATYDERKAADDPAMSVEVESNPSAINRVAKYMVVYEIYESDARDKIDQYVVPIHGLGLWGTLWGFLSLRSDGVTVSGLTYYTHKETPGLGGEVDNPLWKAKWPGRKVFDENGEPAIKVIKGQAGTPEEDPHHVDGLSGATITSNGVTNMLQFWLGDHGFGPFLAGLRGERSTS